MNSVKDQLDQLKNRKMTPKKANLVKHLKNLMKWNLRKSHAPKRKKAMEKVVILPEMINEDE